MDGWKELCRFVGAARHQHHDRDQRESKGNRNRHSFSIRTMLLVVTVIAAVFGWIRWDVQSQREAAAVLRKKGCIVDFENQQPSIADAWLAKLFGEEFAADSVSVWCLGQKVTDADLGYLPDLGKISFLGLENCTQITDAGLARLAGVKQIKSLMLGYTRITDLGVRRLANVKGIESLNLRGTKVTDAGLTSLCNLTRLKQLTLCNTQISDAGLATLRGITGLQSLALVETRVTDAGIPYLQQMTNLNALWTSQELGKNGMARLRMALPNVTIDQYDSSQNIVTGFPKRPHHKITVIRRSSSPSRRSHSRRTSPSP